MDYPAGEWLGGNAVLYRPAALRPVRGASSIWGRCRRYGRLAVDVAFQLLDQELLVFNRGLDQVADGKHANDLTFLQYR